FVRSVPLPGGPVTVGSSSRADVVLDGGGVGGKHFRLWWRDGRLMLHHVDRGTQTIVNGEPADWVALDPGDEIVAGDYRLVYLAPGNGSSPADGTDGPPHAGF